MPRGGWGATVASCPGLYSNPGRPRAPEFPAGAPRQPGTYQPGPGNGRPYGGQGNAAPPGGQPTGGQTGGRQNYGDNEGGNRQNNHHRQRPQCQICNYCGLVASDCRNQYNPEFQPRNNNNQRAENVASTSYNTDAPVWHLDSGATDHLTSDLACLHLQERDDPQV
jgi:hypothetical protein